MTGAELLARTRKELCLYAANLGDQSWLDERDEVLALVRALDGCVLLTADEAEKVRVALEGAWPLGHGSESVRKALALLLGLHGKSQSA